MATKLTKSVKRETAKCYGNRPVIVTLAPAGGSQTECLIGLRLKGRRTQYVVALSDVYRNAALDYGRKEAAARRSARKNGATAEQLQPLTDLGSALDSESNALQAAIVANTPAAPAA